MEGPGIEGLRAVAGAAADAGAELIYSGGVGSLDHLRELAGLGLDSLAGVIVGRALYEGRFTVGEGQGRSRSGRLPAMAGTIALVEVAADPWNRGLARPAGGQARKRRLARAGREGPQAVRRAGP